jgi:hypothetical protein
MPPSSRCRFPVPWAMQRIADETGAVIGGTLYGDLLSPVGGEADSYIKMLRHDEACPGEKAGPAVLAYVLALRSIKGRRRALL